MTPVMARGPVEWNLWCPAVRRPRTTTPGPKRPPGRDRRRRRWPGSRSRHPPGNFPDQQPGKDQGQSPGNQRTEHGQEGDESNGAPGRLGHPRQPPDQPGHRRGAGDHKAADNDQGHLHGEGNQNPETLPEDLHQLEGLFPQGQAAEKDDNDGAERKHEGVGKIAFAEIGQGFAHPGEGGGLCGCFTFSFHFDFVTHTPPPGTLIT